jgi:hypothetical protein
MQALFERLLSFLPLDCQSRMAVFTEAARDFWQRRLQAAQAFCPFC